VIVTCSAGNSCRKSKSMVGLGPVSASATGAGKRSEKKNNNTNSFMNFAIMGLYDCFTEGTIAIDAGYRDLYTIK
jgi:hypothetical protein